MMPDDTLRQRLLRETYARHVECHEELASTNDYALAVIAENALPLPAIVIADRQTSGRGRGNNRWWSAPGALTFSVLMDDQSAGFDVGGDPRTALLAGLAVADTLAEFLPPDRVTVKWPNDVQIERRKISGILVEIPPTRRDVAVIGIGLNVNNSYQLAPVELQKTATALCDELGQPFSREELLIRLLTNLERTLFTFPATSEQLPQLWKSRCALTGFVIDVQQAAEHIHGLCRGIQPDGALLIETENGLRTVRSASSVRLSD